MMTMPGNSDNQNRLDIKRLKKWAEDSLPLNSTLRAVLLQEKDTMDTNEFLGKASTWTKLARIEDQTARNRLDQDG